MGLIWDLKINFKQQNKQVGHYVVCNRQYSSGEVGAVFAQQDTTQRSQPLSEQGENNQEEKRGTIVDLI